jgi:DUF4097 and DUF4098 domain-containing protein YvlB
MKKRSKTAVVLVMAAALIAAGAYAGDKDRTTRTFEKKEVVRVNTISGDLVVKKGATDQIEVEVIASYSPSDSFEPKFRERGNVLKMSERMYGSNSGSSTWILTVPEGTEIDFSTASGDLTVEELSGEFSAETASGDIVLEDCRGEFDFSTASGDIEVMSCNGAFDISTASGDIDMEDCHGEFELSTASGDVDASGILIEDASSFSTASGRVNVKLAQTAEHDLELSSASGRVILNYDGHPIKGFFEFTAKVRNGHISAPFDFDDEEEFRRWDDRYVRKSFTRDSDTPQIIIETASGKAILRKA